MNINVHFLSLSCNPVNAKCTVYASIYHTLHTLSKWATILHTKCMKQARFSLNVATTHIRSSTAYKFLCSQMPLMETNVHELNTHTCVTALGALSTWVVLFVKRKDSFYFLCWDLFSLLSLPTDLHKSCWRWSTEKMRRTKATLFFNPCSLSCCTLVVHKVDKERRTIRTQKKIKKNNKNRTRAK